ncbi:MAG: hypothetical protein J0I06_12035 [Planctomycetes bacterium]|nr:hypothetical protein [Planctomycetota bacterium]
MTRTTHAPRARRGVTLVEMLVATAMCILGMWMLTWMFQQATASFSLANAQVALTGQERAVTTVMQRDLACDVFADDDTLPNRGRKVSDRSPGDPVPKGGYLWARSSPPGVGGTILEATDSNGFASYRATDHFIQFTAILPDTPGNRFISEVPAGSGTTRAGTAAEIAYFLVPNGTTTGGAQLYDLMRVQRIVALNQYDAQDYLNLAVQPGYQAGDLVHEVMVCSPPNTATSTPAKMHALADLAQAVGPSGATAPRIGGAAQYAGGPTFPRAARSLTSAPPSKRYGEDRLLSGVLSFEVKFTGQGTGWPTPFSSNSDYPYDTLPAGSNYEFDTSRSPTLKITGVQIRIRAVNGTNTRQTTIVIAL